jgi:hypothetical protein
VHHNLLNLDAAAVAAEQFLTYHSTWSWMRT